MAFWLPNRYFCRVSDIDINDDILKLGIRNVLLDIDNTILTRDTSTVPDDVKAWLDELLGCKINVCLISNDWHSNVTTLASKLKLPIVTKSLKPLPHSFWLARKRIGAKRSNTLMIGDQLMTDVFGAHFVGLRVYLVQPLVEQDLKHTLMLRKIERKILGNKHPEPGKQR